MLGPLRPSGMERMLVSAAPYWPKGMAHVLIGQGDFHPFRGQLEDAGYRVETIPPVRERRGADALATLLQAGRPDVLHIHAESGFINSVRAARRKLPIVRTVHSVFPTRGRDSWSRRLQAKAVDKHVGQFIAPSEEVAQNEARIGRTCRVIVNWVSQEFVDESPAPGLGDYAIIVGNASHIKNHVLALEAVARAGVSLAFVGDETGASQREHELLDGLEREGRLVHRGPADPMPWLLGAGAFLMPSRHEGMGVALAEALQLGVPAIIAKAPGLRWAAGLEGVAAVPFDVDAWEHAIPRAMNLGRDAVRPHPDFSPARGAFEYSAAYARALRK